VLWGFGGALRQYVCYRLPMEALGKRHETSVQR
jgi:hypothetical protein